jgi:hypothetical protein
MSSAAQEPTKISLITTGLICGLGVSRFIRTNLITQLCDQKGGGAD